MNKQEISEIRRRLNPEANNPMRICGCYVNEKREIISTFGCAPLTLPQEEAEKYMSVFKKVLSGAQGKNLVDIPFSASHVADSDAHHLLMSLRDTALEDTQILSAFYDAVIASTDMEGNYLILLLCDAYDLPYRAKDAQKVDDASEEVFDYMLCAVCPVKRSKPALRYFAPERAFRAREEDWVVTAPEIGFMFPAFDDRAANIYAALYYTRDAAADYESFVDAVFGARAPMPAAAQKELFQSVLADALESECNLEVVKSVQEELRDRIEEQQSDKEAGSLSLSTREIGAILQTCGVSAQRAAVFEEKYAQAFDGAAQTPAVNIMDTKQLELRTAGVVVHVDAQCADMVQTRTIDGIQYVLIRADEGVEVNGVSIAVRDA